MTLFLPRRCPEGVSRLPGVTVRGPRRRGAGGRKQIVKSHGVLRINGRRRAIERVGTNWQTRRRRFRWRRSSRYARKKRSRVLSDMAGARPDLTVEGSLRQNASNISTPRVRRQNRRWGTPGLGTPAPAPGPLFESDSAPRKAGAQGPKRKGREYVTLTAYAATRRKLYVVLHGEV